MGKKICVVATVPSVVRSFLLPTVEYLRKNTDWQITVVCSDQDHFAAEIPEGVRFFPVQMKRGVSLSGIGACRKLLRLFRQEKFDLVQYCNPNSSLYAALAAKLAGVPVRLYCQWGMVFVGFTGVKRWVFRQVERIICRLSTFVAPDSLGNLALARQLGMYDETKSGVVGSGSACGVDLTKFDLSRKALWRQEVRKELGIGESETAFVFVGRFNGDKGMQELYGAFRQLPGGHLIMVGWEEDMSAVDPELVSWIKSCPRVHFVGVTRQVERYLAAADALALPSHREGFGTVVIEGMAMALPILVSDIPGPTDVVEDGVNGYVVPVRNAEALARAMAEVAAQPEKARLLGENGRRRVEESYDQQVVLPKILAHRKALMGQAERSSL